jgi:NAD+ diphosphatase
MIHDISPRKMFNEFRQQLPIASDYLMFFENEKVLLKKTGTSFALPTFEDVAVCNEGLFPLSHYLFSIDDRAFFLTESKPSELNDDFVMQPQNEFRHFPAPELGFAGASASHLWRWERSNKFCGCCGTKLDRSKTERAFCCPQCGHCVYPRIAPVVIVAVSAGSRLLMVRNKNNLIPKRFLVSGFVDIGENLEQAAAREVLKKRASE